MKTKLIILLTCGSFATNMLVAQVKSKSRASANTNTPPTVTVAKKIDISSPSLKNITEVQQINAVKAIVQYAAKDAMNDFFRLYIGYIKPNIFPQEVIVKAGSFGYMFIESGESANMQMKDFIKSINYNLQKPLVQFASTVAITKPNKALQGGTAGITNYIFATYDASLQTIIKNAVDVTFQELAHPTNTKSFFGMVQGYDFGELDKDARPYFASFIKKQLKARFEMEELLLRDNPPVANNSNVIAIFTGKAEQ